MSNTQTGVKLPDIPGLVTGIVDQFEAHGRKYYTLQCANCLTLETPEHLVLMKTRFHARSPKSDNPRLCTACRILKYAGCNCDGCKEDRKA